jgi:hypothetical protein
MPWSAACGASLVALLVDVCWQCRADFSLTVDIHQPLVVDMNHCFVDVCQLDLYICIYGAADDFQIDCRKIPHALCVGPYSTNTITCICR